MAEKQTVRPDSAEKRTEAEGLPLEKLEAQVGSLLPDRIEMRRRRRRRGGSGPGCGGICIDIL